MIRLREYSDGDVKDRCWKEIADSYGGNVKGKFADYSILRLSGYSTKMSTVLIFESSKLEKIGENLGRSL